MLKLTTLPDKKELQLLANYLQAQQINNCIRNQQELWIIDHDQLASAREILQDFSTQQDKSKFKVAKSSIRKSVFKAPKAKSRLGRILGNRVGPVTLILMTLCIIVFVLGYFSHYGFYAYLSFSNYRFGLPEMRQGQFWRLFTPMFMHFGLLHILFNLFWLYEFGTFIENKISSWFLLFLVLSIALFANVMQYIVSGPAFGGMSGVAYGLFGYLWIRAKFDPWSGIYLSQQIVILFLVWLVLCFTGLIGPIANTSHVTGLICGIVIAFLHILYINYKIRKH